MCLNELVASRAVQPLKIVQNPIDHCWFPRRYSTRLCGIDWPTRVQFHSLRPLGSQLYFVFLASRPHHRPCARTWPMDAPQQSKVVSLDLQDAIPARRQQAREDIDHHKAREGITVQISRLVPYV